MKTLTKIALVGVVATGLYLGRRYYQNKLALSKLDAKIIALKNLKLGFDKIELKLDLLLSNISDYNIGISTLKLLTIKQIQFYSKQDNKLIGSANVDISGLKIRANDAQRINDILVRIDNPLLNISSLTRLFRGNVLDNLKIELVYDSFGKERQLNIDNYIS